MGSSQNSYREINGSAFLFFPFHFFSSQKWHRRRGFNQPIQMNKWRRDPISSWQSFWNRGQLISRMSQQNSLFSLLRAWHGRLLLSCHQLGGRHPGKAAASVQLHLTASSCTLPYLYIFVFVKKRLAFANIFIFQPSHPSSSSSPGII